MDRDEARALLQHELEAYAGRSHLELETLIGRTEATAVLGASGIEYQVEVNACWDDETDGTIRVIGSIDDGTFLDALRPLTDSILVARPR